MVLENYKKNNTGRQGVHMNNGTFHSESKDKEQDRSKRAAAGNDAGFG
jgi:hypothetical protein